jgi:predicted amidophosphoribosyltransferase
LSLSPKVQLQDIMKFTDVLLPPQNRTFKTSYFLDKIMKPWELPFVQEEYCGECLFQWQGTETVCRNCAAKGTESLRYHGSQDDQKHKKMKKHYFIMFNVIEQLQQMLKRKFFSAG